MSDLTERLRAGNHSACERRYKDGLVTGVGECPCIERLEAADRIDLLEGQGPADIGMVDVLMNFYADGKNHKLWREADDG